ncbi:MAG: hypothetical protein Q9192_008652, partial [Flavoplaca navasiana]
MKVQVALSRDKLDKVSTHYLKRLWKLIRYALFNEDVILLVEPIQEVDGAKVTIALDNSGGLAPESPA